MANSKFIEVTLFSEEAQPRERILVNFDHVVYLQDMGGRAGLLPSNDGHEITVVSESYEAIAAQLSPLMPLPY